MTSPSSHRRGECRPPTTPPPSPVPAPAAGSAAVSFKPPLQGVDGVGNDDDERQGEDHHRQPGPEGHQVLLVRGDELEQRQHIRGVPRTAERHDIDDVKDLQGGDRKSTRLNSSHGYISYAVFCLKKKNNTNTTE